jgi:ATP-binding cassette subfamily B protein
MPEDDDNNYRKAFSFKVWAAMWPFFKPYRWMVAKVLSLMFACSVIGVFMPLYQKYFIDAFISPSRTDGLTAAILIGVAAIFVNLICVVTFSKIAIKVEMGFSRDLKKKCFDHLQTLSISYYNKFPVGYIMARVMSDTDKIGLLAAWGFVNLIWVFSYAVFAMIAMLLLEFRLGLWLAILTPVMAIVTTWFQNNILRRNREVRHANSLISGSFNEGILGARASKTLVIEDVNSSEFAQRTDEMYRCSVRTAVLNAAYTPVMMAFGSFAVAMILVRGSSYVTDGAMALGTLSALVSYSINIFDPIQHLSYILSDAMATQANIERVDALLKQEPEIYDSPEVVEVYGDSFNPRRENWEPISGDIRFDDVTFKYPESDEYVLEHFNMDIPAGTCVAIVGETGAGKSTLVSLVCRFFEPTSGRILIDGRDYRERSQLWLHSNIGYVLQSPHLFSGTIRDNIRYSRLNATDEDIMAASRLVSADSVIAKLPMGLDSDVGEGGDRLSTGEKQLISFARAVLADPRIFVLDEATSSIDTETERSIQNAISKILRNRTSFLIAHRLSTIKAADLILVVSDGKIIERGTHRELLRKKGHYTRLYSMQYEEDIMRYEGKLSALGTKNGT